MKQTIQVLGNMTSKLLSVDFEIFGHVQGVYFRKSTKKEATNLGVRGWCMNTDTGTVKGSMQGETDKIQKMKHWLQYTGSPGSNIEKAVFSNEKEIDTFTYNDFQVKK